MSHLVVAVPPVTSTEAVRAACELLELQPPQVEIVEYKNLSTTVLLIDMGNNVELVCVPETGELMSECEDKEPLLAFHQAYVVQKAVLDLSRVCFDVHLSIDEDDRKIRISLTENEEALAIERGSQRRHQFRPQKRFQNPGEWELN